MEKVPMPFCLSFCEEQQVPLELHRAELQTEFAVSPAAGAALSQHSGHLGTVVTSVTELCKFMSKVIAADLRRLYTA